MDDIFYQHVSILFTLYDRLIVSFILGLIFIATMCIDLAVQWILLKKEPQSLP